MFDSHKSGYASLKQFARRRARASPDVDAGRAPEPGRSLSHKADHTVRCSLPTESVAKNFALKDETGDNRRSMQIQSGHRSRLCRGGSPDLKFFLEAWKDKLAKFKHRPMKHPVIVLIDNDDGATQIFKLLQSKTFGATIGHATDLPFYHLGGPLYLVKTPIKGPDNKVLP